MSNNLTWGKLLSLTLLSILATQSVVVAQERLPQVTTVLAKNNSSGLLHIWINGSYQGYVRGRETRYSVSDGFITNDSDRPMASGGKTPVRESHAGWDVKDGKALCYFEVVRNDGIAWGEINLYPDSRNTGYVWVGDASPGPGISAEEQENAPAIIKGAKKKSNDGSKIQWLSYNQTKGEYVARLGITSDPAAPSETSGALTISPTGRIKGKVTEVYRQQQRNSLTFAFDFKLSSVTYYSYRGGLDNKLRIKASAPAEGRTLKDGEPYGEFASDVRFELTDSGTVIRMDGNQSILGSISEYVRNQ